MADHYQTLGVEPNADLTIIKRRYRLLVRENHPDAVEASRRQNAHERMLEINAAWTILSDPAERARYDRARMPVVVPPSSSERAARASRGAPSSSASSRTSGRPSTSPRAPGRGRSSERQGNPRTRLLTMVFEAAELYFFHGRAQEAIEMCNRVMQFDARNAEAPALLGDIYAEQGRKDVAVLMYERAVRNQPDNALYRQKWEQLKTATASSPSTSSSSSASTPASTPRPSSSTAGGAASTSGPRYGPNAVRAKYNVAQRIAQSEGARTEGARTEGARNGGAATPRESANATSANATSANATSANATSANAAGVDGVNGNAGARFARVVASPDASIGSGIEGNVAPSNASANGSVAVERTLSDRPQVAGGVALALVATGLVVWGNLEIAGNATKFVSEPSLPQLVLTSAAGAGMGAALPLLNLVKSCGQVRRGAPAFTGAPLVFCMALAGAIAFPLAWLLYLVSSMAWRLWHRSLLTVLVVALFLSLAMLAGAPPNQSSEHMMDLVQSVLIFWSGRAILPSVIAGWALGSMLRRR